MFPRRLLVFVLSLYLFWPLAALAENQVQAAERESTTEMTDVLPGSARAVGKDQQNEVLAKAWIYRNQPSVQSPFPEINNPYILFLRFRTIEGDRPIEKGLVACKIEYMNGDRTPARKMELRSGYFVAGIDLQNAGFYSLHIGSKLEDEKKRQFSFNFSIR